MSHSEKLARLSKLFLAARTRRLAGLKHTPQQIQELRSAANEFRQLAPERYRSFMRNKKLL